PAAEVGHFLQRLAAVRGDGRQFLGVHPDEARRARAAVATARAAKAQAILVPRFRHAVAFSPSGCLCGGAFVIIPTAGVESSLPAQRATAWRSEGTRCLNLGRVAGLVRGEGGMIVVDGSG